MAIMMERVTVRFTPESRQRVAQAAGASRVTVSNFIRAVAEAAAEEDLVAVALDGPPASEPPAGSDNPAGG